MTKFRLSIAFLLCISHLVGYAQQVILLREDHQKHTRLSQNEEVFLLKSDSLFRDSSTFPWCRMKIAGECKFNKDNTCGFLEYTVVANNIAAERGYNAAYFHKFGGTGKKDTIEFSFIRLPNELLPISAVDTIPTITILNFKDRKTTNLSIENKEFVLPNGTYIDISMDTEKLSSKKRNLLNERLLKRAFHYTKRSQRSSDARKNITFAFTFAFGIIVGTPLAEFYIKEPIKDLPRLSAEIMIRDLKKYKFLVTPID